MSSASGESCILVVLRFQRPAFDESLQKRVSRPLWALPDWPEVASALRPISRAIHAEILSLFGMWAAANQEAAEERRCKNERSYRAGEREKPPWLPDSGGALILLRNPVMDHLMSGWPIAMDTAGVGHVTPFCPECRESSWSSYWSFRHKSSGRFHLCFWCRKDMRSAEDPEVERERERRSSWKKYQAVSERIRCREEDKRRRRQSETLSGIRLETELIRRWHG
jgi:hypothetical protein